MSNTDVELGTSITYKAKGETTVINHKFHYFSTFDLKTKSRQKWLLCQFNMRPTVPAMMLGFNFYLLLRMDGF
jgi:hypothetical protein